MNPYVCGSGHKLTTSECCDGENFVFIPIQRISDVTKPSRCHAYVLPNNDVFIWSFDTNQMIKISSSTHIGQDGKSAYELALEEGFQGSLNNWLVSLIGAPGKKGDQGLSAYEVAIASGFKGTMAEWVASLKGEKGDPGTTDWNGLENKPDFALTKELEDHVDDNDNPHGVTAGQTGAFTKDESSVNVLDTITGTKPTIYSETLLVDGEQGTGSIFVKDQSIHENVLGSKNDLTNSVWAVSKHKAPTIVKNGLGNGIDSIIQEYGATETVPNNYLDIIEQRLFNGVEGVRRILPGKWYTLTFKAKGHTANARVASYIYPRIVDVYTKMILNGVERPNLTPADGYLDLGLTNEWQTFTVSFKTRTDLDESAFGFGGNLLFRLISSHKGHKVELGDFDISEGKEVRKTPTVAPEDVGLVYGKQLNLFDGSSNDWEEFTFSGWDMGGSSTSLSTMGLAVGDKIACRCEIDNSKGTLKAKFKLVFRNDSGAILEVTPAIISPGEIGISQGEYIIPEGTTNIFCAKASKFDGTTQSTIRVRRNKLIKGSLAAMDEWTPSYYDYETNKGVPNKLKTFDFRNMSEISQFATMWEQQDVSVKYELDSVNKGIKLTTGTNGLSTAGRIYNAQANGDSHINGTSAYTYYLDVTMQKDSIIGIGEWTQITTQKYWYKAPFTGRQIVKVQVKGNFSGSRLSIAFINQGIPYIIHRVKWIEGTNIPVNDWSLDTLIFDPENYIVPFSDDQYIALADPLRSVRAETIIPGRGAELRFDFNMIEELEKRHPYLFKRKVLSEKIAKYLSVLKKLSVTSSYRGQGLDKQGGHSRYHARIYIKPRHYENYWGFSTPVGSSGFTIQETMANKGNIDQIQSNGLYRFMAVSYKNDGIDNGAISDGITPAWVEVQDIKLIVELEINGKSVVEEISAEVSGNAIANFVGSGTTQTVNMDFLNKIARSTLENPNWLSVRHCSELVPPIQFSEEAVQARYDAISKLDDTRLSSTSPTGLANQFPAALIKWNIVEDIAKRYSGLFEAYGADDLTSKISLAKKIVTSAIPSVWGFGSGPNGYKLSIARYGNATWGQATVSKTDTATKISLPDLEPGYWTNNLIQLDGCIYIIAYTDVSSASVASTISIDYACLDYKVNLKLTDIIDARIAKHTALLNQTIDRLEVLEGGN